MADLVYVRARGVLLDALDALAEQHGAVVLVGAQAIYMHTGEADLAVAPYTTDADLAIDPVALRSVPKLADALAAAGFSPGGQPGQWIGKFGIVVDVMVPAAEGGAGRRGARLGVHGNRAARKARGLEAVLVDHAVEALPALDVSDPRVFRVRVAGPGALLVAKLHKIAERTGTIGRQDDKDALDVFRLLKAIPTERLAVDLERLGRDPRSSQVTREAIAHVDRLFGSESREGVAMVVRATEIIENPATIARSCVFLVRDLIDDLGSRDWYG